MEEIPPPSYEESEKIHNKPLEADGPEVPQAQETSSVPPQIPEAPKKQMPSEI